MLTERLLSVAAAEIARVAENQERNGGSEQEKSF